MALVVAQPANASRQTLELDVFFGGVEPVVQVLVVREELLERLVGNLDVLRVCLLYTSDAADDCSIV